MSAQNKPDTTGNNADSSTPKLESNPPPNQNERQNNNFANQRRGGGGGPGRFGGPNRKFGPGNMNVSAPLNSSPHLERVPHFQQKQFGGPRNKRGTQGGPGPGPNDDRPDRQSGMNNRNMNEKFNEKLAQIAGPTYELPPMDASEKKFSGRNRLYVGNIGNDVTEDELNEMFKSFGEISETFINKDKNFAFVKYDFHTNAMKAKLSLDGTMYKNRSLRIRFAPASTSIRVKNLTPFVTNELLHFSFAIFGEIERAKVCVDERGRPTGEGIVDYVRKGSATHAIRKCSEGCFFLTGSLRPTIVEAYEYVDDADGFPEKNLPKKNSEYHKEREVGPRFASPGSFEDDYGMRWKQLYDLYAQKMETVNKELEMEKNKLTAQMELARYEHETEMLREQLRAREMDRERQKREWEMKERQADEQRQRLEEQVRRQQEEMESRIHHQEEEMRRRQQENNLFMQAHNLDNMLEQQEQAYDEPQQGYANGK